MSLVFLLSRNIFLTNHNFTLAVGNVVPPRPIHPRTFHAIECSGTRFRSAERVRQRLEYMWASPLPPFPVLRYSNVSAGCLARAPNFRSRNENTIPDKPLCSKEHTSITPIKICILNAGHQFLTTKNRHPSCRLQILPPHTQANAPHGISKRIYQIG